MNLEHCMYGRISDNPCPFPPVVIRTNDRPEFHRFGVTHLPMCSMHHHECICGTCHTEDVDVQHPR